MTVSTRCTSSSTVIIALTLGVATLISPPASPSSTPEAAAIVRLVNQQVSARSAEQRFTLTTTERNGRSITRKFVALWNDETGAANAERTDTAESRGTPADMLSIRRSVASILEPRLLRGTKLLTVDYPDQRDDDQWLYTQADRRSRRIAASKSGDSFFGSVFSYEDIKSANRLNLVQYDWRLAPEADPKGIADLNSENAARCKAAGCTDLELTPVSDKLVRSLGFSRAVVRIDTERLVPLRWDFFDVRDSLFKTVEASNLKSVQGIWTAHRFTARTLRTQRESVLEVSTMNYGVAVDPNLLTREGLGRELP